MKLHELSYTEGARHKRNRVGRGTSSGNGKTAGRGQKGAGARSGGGKGPVINLDALNRFENGTVVTPELLIETGLVRKELDGVKILGKGNLEKALTVKAHKFSEAAVKAIEAAGGSTEVI